MRRRASEGVGRLALALVLTAYPPDRLASQQVNNSGALFLVFPVGARAVGMGQTAAALDGRGEAAFWNPAGLATLEKNEFGLQSATLVAGNTDALTAYFPSHRSEEHTSELQSRSDLVCRLLLEKKKKRQYNTTHYREAQH